MKMTCSDTCKLSKNENCMGKCITFSIQDAQVPEEDMRTEECWALDDCSGFPDLMSFMENTQCNTRCATNHFSVSSDDSTLYFSICVEEYNQDGPVPNVCEMWKSITGEPWIFSFLLLAFIFILT